MTRHLMLFTLVACSAAAVPAVAGQRVTDYTVGPQDVLMITTFGEQELTNKFRVDSDGTISFPLLNRVAVGGLTPAQIEAKLKRELVQREFLKNPQITVDVAEFRSRSVYIIGAVRSPAEYKLVGDMTLIAAIAQAGGLSPGASNEITIMRPRTPAGGPLSPDRAQNADITVVKMSDLQSGIMAQNIALQDGDTIWVPMAERFYVSGFVRNVGAYVHERGLTVQQALVLAGGVTEMGSTKRITIERVVGSRKKTIKASLADPVLPNDTIKVDRRIF
jgi:polysaccharide biosynthesis/export protein